MVILTFTFGRELRKQPSDLFVLNLAVADLLSLVVFLSWLEYVLSFKTIYNLSYYFYESINSVVLFSSGNAILSISMDRFVALVWPFRNKMIFRKRVALRLIILSWLVGLGYRTLSFFSVSFKSPCFFVGITVFHSLPLVLILFLHCVIAYFAIRQGKCILNQKRSVGATCSYNSHCRLDMRITSNSDVFVCLYYATYSPVTVYVIYLSIGKGLTSVDHLRPRTCFCSFLFLNSRINPFIYACHMNQFKSVFRRKLWVKITDLLQS